MILPEYETPRNKPDRDGSSRLSAYLHFGFISPLEITLAVQNADAPQEAKDAYLEELIVRRELSFNFTYEIRILDSLASFPAWAQKQRRRAGSSIDLACLARAARKRRDTHDELWNAARREMVVTGEMHNYVRMLWGKNVIAWSPSSIAFEPTRSATLLLR